MLTIVVVQFLIIHNIAILERLTAFVRGKKKAFTKPRIFKISRIIFISDA